jgi:hypothetical protein
VLSEVIEMKNQKKKYKLVPTNFDLLRVSPDDLRNIADALIPGKNLVATNILYDVLRNWDFRKPRTNRNFGGEWLFRSHEQFLFNCAAGSQSASERALAILDENELIQRRKSDFGSAKNVLHLAPTKRLDALLKKINDTCAEYWASNPTNKYSLLRHALDGRIQLEDDQPEKLTLRRVFHLRRLEPNMSKNTQFELIEKAFLAAEKRLKDPDQNPYPSKKPTITHKGSSDEPTVVDDCSLKMPTIASEGNYYKDNGKNNNTVKSEDNEKEDYLKIDKKTEKKYSLSPIPSFLDNTAPPPSNMSSDVVQEILNKVPCHFACPGHTAELHDHISKNITDEAEKVQILAKKITEDLAYLFVENEDGWTFKMHPDYPE